MSDVGDLRRLTHAVTHNPLMADVWTALHEQALRSTGATTSVLLRVSRGNDELVPVSAVGLDDLAAEPWMTSDAARRVAERAWNEGGPIVVSDVPELNARLRTPAGMVIPVSAREGRLGLLVLGINRVGPARAATAQAALIGELVALALERARFEHESGLHRDLGVLVSDFSRAISASLHMGASLEIFCERARRLFASDRVSVWLHDRRARVIELVASSDVAEVAERTRVSVDQPANQIATAMRAPRAALIPAGAPGLPPTVLAPLRGRRRALGTLSMEGVRSETRTESELVERIEDIGRQLSAAIENLWLLEDVLRARRELKDTVNSLADLVVVSDQRLSVTHSNEAFAKRWGKPSDQILGSPLAQFFAPDVVNWLATLVDSDASSFPPQELQDPVLGGSFLFTVSPLVGRDEDRIGLVIVARDVSDTSRYEAERAELRKRLTQSEKLAALGQFVAGIAHELNNPLQGVLGHLELMLHESAQLPTRLKRDLKIVFREAERAAKIVHNLLVFAGSRRIKRRRLNVNLVISRALTLRSSARGAAGIDLVKDLTPKLPHVAGDSLLLQQAILNILVNAEQALAATSGPRRIEVRTLRRDNRVVVEIGDNGPGIPDEVLPRLFEPFFTTKEVGKGTGLGLAIAYGIVQEHGGELHASKRQDRGALFTLELPSTSDGVE